MVVGEFLEYEKEVNVRSILKQERKSEKGKWIFFS